MCHRPLNGGFIINQDSQDKMTTFKNQTKLKIFERRAERRIPVVCAALYANALSYFQQHLYMAFFTSAVGVLQTLVIALGAGLGIWGVINLLEGYGNDNPGANAHVR